MPTDPNAEAGKGTESMRRYGLAVRAAATACCFANCSLLFSEKTPEVKDQSFSFTELLRLCPKPFLTNSYKPFSAARKFLMSGFFFNLRVIPVCSCRSRAP
jgi:hypothetical protein